MEKYYEEFLSKLKNVKRQFDNLQEYIINVYGNYYDFMDVYKPKKRRKESDEILKAMNDFTNELVFAENTYKLSLDEFKRL
ncbi:MAG: hypothetical protein LBV42_01825 [Methanobrevibacter sp.]|jgi:hypothetical protein|nr:hypothetical protein [Methanobrevibacter sp.]